MPRSTMKLCTMVGFSGLGSVALTQIAATFRSRLTLFADIVIALVAAFSRFSSTISAFSERQSSASNVIIKRIRTSVKPTTPRRCRLVTFPTRTGSKSRSPLRPRYALVDTGRKSSKAFFNFVEALPPAWICEFLSSLK